MSSYLHQLRTKISTPCFPLKQCTLLHLLPISFHSTTTPTNPIDRNISRGQHLQSLFKQCSTIIHLNQIHTQILKTGYHQNLFIIGKLITYCAVSLHNSMDYAVSVFEQVENPDGFLWNTMIRGLGKSGEPMKAFGYYKRMLDVEERADNFTYSFLLKICGQVGDSKLGKETHCCCLKEGWNTHVHVRNTLIHMYGLFKDMKTATSLFDEIPESNVVAWNTIIDCYVSCGEYKEALDMFSRMYNRSGIEPDDATFVVVLSACSSLGALGFGEWVHSLVDGTGFDGNVAVCTALLDMYAKCGEIEKARLVFSKMNKRNAVSWNSMILGLALHGYAEDALGLFCEMQRLTTEVPNDVTFLGVLCACSHGGLVEEGRMYFDSMVRDYGIQPTMKHYGCMVDLLGRAGLVEEAYELIQSMPMQCNAIVLRALLGACGVHGNCLIGEQVRSDIAKLGEDHSGDYLLIVNMYANEGRWSDVLGVREAMRSRQVEKPKPGNSSINI